MKSQLFKREALAAEDGGISVLNVYFLMTLAILAGVAVDVSNLMSSRTQLQVAADAAAHAALVEREWNDKEKAVSRALDVAKKNMPVDEFGEVLTAQNIVFGTYDRETRAFTADPESRDAVMVETERVGSNGNAVSSFLLQFVGIMDWDVRRRSIFETYYPTCLMEGISAQGMIDVQSNNSYFNGFCLHSNDHVSINNNNYFEPGTVVSMPDSNDLVVSTTGNQEPKNEGLYDALREGKYFIKILDRYDRIEQGVQDEDSRYARDYITNFNVVPVNIDIPEWAQGQKFIIEPTVMQKGRIYRFKCDQQLRFKKGTYREMVILADCPVLFEEGVTLEDMTVLTSYAADKAFSAPNGITLGKSDGCDPGGSTQLVTRGHVDFSSGLSMNGSQIIAGGDVKFTANGDGVNGASIVAGGVVEATSNGQFAFCGDGMEHSFLAEYFRLAQ